MLVFWNPFLSKNVGLENGNSVENHVFYIFWVVLLENNILKTEALLIFIQVCIKSYVNYHAMTFLVSLEKFDMIPIFYGPTIGLHRIMLILVWLFNNDCTILTLNDGYEPIYPWLVAYISNFLHAACS